jgi:hypothetical protein
MVSALFNDFVNQGLFSNMGFAQVFYFEAGLLGKVLGVGPDLFTQGLCPLGVVKYSDMLGSEICGHSIGKANARKGAGYNHAVKTGQFATDFVGVPLCEQLHKWPPRIGLAVPSQISGNC